MMAGVELEKAASGHEMSNQESEKRRVVAIPTTLQVYLFSILSSYNPGTSGSALWTLNVGV